MYRYITTTRDELLDVFESLAKQLWISHQAAYEYQRRRPGVIADKIRQFDTVINDLNKKMSILLGEDSGRPLILGEHTDEIKDLFNRISESIDKSKQYYNKLLSEDMIRNKIDELFDGRVGKPYPENRLKEIYRAGEERFNSNQPPGYMDDKPKEGVEKYGDLILWFQIMDEAKLQNKPIVFITDDRKEDWWHKENNIVLGPRAELRREINCVANVCMYMYTTEQFLKYAAIHLKRHVDDKVYTDIESIAEEDEATPVDIDTIDMPNLRKALQNLQQSPSIFETLAQVQQAKKSPSIFETLAQVQLAGGIYDAWKRDHQADGLANLKENQESQTTYKDMKSFKSDNTDSQDNPSKDESVHDDEIAE